MCRPENDHDQLKNQAETLHLSLLYLTQTIHRAVESVRSTHALRTLDMFSEAGTPSTSNSASSSQVSLPAAAKRADDGYSSGPSAPSDGPTTPAQERSRPKEPTTARGFPRINLEHPKYRDYAASSSTCTAESSTETNSSTARKRTRGGVASTFPLILHTLLESAVAHGYDDVICWLGHGRAWKVIDQERFIREVMPKYYRQTKYVERTTRCLKEVHPLTVVLLLVHAKIPLFSASAVPVRL